MGSPTIIRLCRYIIYSNYFNRNPEGRGPAAPCKRLRYSNRAVGNSNKRGTQNSHKVVYDKFIKQIRTERHSFNTTGTKNYRVQLAVPLQLIIIQYDSTV